MTKLNSYFKEFLSKIEPSKEAKHIAQTAHTKLREFIEDDDVFGERVKDTYLYGSYRRNTAIENIKDVDIVLLTDFDITNSENSPKKVLSSLKDALSNYYDGPKDLAYQRRSIRVDKPLESSDSKLTLDVIPAVECNNSTKEIFIPDRSLNEWIKSNPKGHIEKTNHLNSKDYGNGMFVPLVKMFKWWWMYRCEDVYPDEERPKPKGFWLECLVGNCFTPGLADWADNFLSLLRRIIDIYGNYSEVPELIDPGLPDQTIKTSMNFEEFKIFLNEVKQASSLVEEAILEKDDLSSSIKWRDIFGDAFPLYSQIERKYLSAEKVFLGSDSHKNNFRFCPMKLDSKRKHVRIDASCYIEDEFIMGLENDGPTLLQGINLKFEAKTKIKPPFEVYWQVVNTGRHAEQENGLRGEYFKSKEKNASRSDKELVDYEMTSYTGKHWIQCFIVKGGYCVARSDKFFVNIYNNNEKY